MIDNNNNGPESLTRATPKLRENTVMAILVDFMLVYLPTATVSLRPPLAISAGPTTIFSTTAQIMHSRLLSGTSYSLLKRIGAIVKMRNVKMRAILECDDLVEEQIEQLVKKFLKEVKNGTWQSKWWPFYWTEYANGKDEELEEDKI